MVGFGAGPPLLVLSPIPTATPGMVRTGPDTETSSCSEFGEDVRESNDELLRWSAVFPGELLLRWREELRGRTTPPSEEPQDTRSPRLGDFANDDRLSRDSALGDLEIPTFMRFSMLGELLIMAIERSDAREEEDMSAALLKGCCFMLCIWWRAAEGGVGDCKFFFRRAAGNNTRKNDSSRKRRQTLRSSQEPINLRLSLFLFVLPDYFFIGRDNDPTETGDHGEGNVGKCTF